MDLNDALRQVGVLGAAGKMGRGIALLLLQEMCRLEAEQKGKVGTGEFSLVLFDLDTQALRTLRSYFRKYLRLYAEKNINALRDYYAESPDLVSNGEIIEAFMEGALDNVRLSAHLDTIKDMNLIFEAVPENIDTKTIIFSALAGEAYFFSNTSSIPIHALDTKANLQGKIVGFHFYNPPPVQTLLELIEPKGMVPELHEMSLELARRLNKNVIYSKDLAGFIGNGHLFREVNFAMQKLKELGCPQPEGIQMMDTITREYLMRPMGIFELVEYLGLDVAHQIGKIMSEYLSEKFEMPQTIERKEPEQKGHLPKDWIHWKNLLRHPKKKEIIEKQLAWIMSSEDDYAKIAREYLLHSHEIGEKLVRDGVADSMEDVSTVLKQGFHHLYGLEQIPARSVR